jgi:hypothetical protein
MSKLVWDSSFRRALKARTRNDRDLQERILDTLDELVADPSFRHALSDSQAGA